MFHYLTPGAIQNSIDEIFIILPAAVFCHVALYDNCLFDFVGYCNLKISELDKMFTLELVGWLVSWCIM